MEQLTETITLDVEESNELAFKLKVEGAESPVKVRLVCENEQVAYMFSGRGTSEDGVVQFIVPQMKGKLSEGTYPARVEVLIDNRYFVPVQFNMHFKKTMQVFAESVQVVSTPIKPEIRVSAAPIVVTQPKRTPQVSEAKPAVIASPNTAPVKKVEQRVQESNQKPHSSTLREKFSKNSENVDDDLQEFAKKLMNTVKRK